jgi:hypothetical protein
MIALREIAGPSADYLYIEATDETGAVTVTSIRLAALESGALNLDTELDAIRARAAGQAEARARWRAALGSKLAE